jgi:hypothetical protein
MQMIAFLPAVIGLSLMLWLLVVAKRGAKAAPIDATPNSWPNDLEAYKRGEMALEAFLERWSGRVPFNFKAAEAKLKDAFDKSNYPPGPTYPISDGLGFDVDGNLVITPAKADGPFTINGVTYCDPNGRPPMPPDIRPGCTCMTALGGFCSVHGSASIRPTVGYAFPAYSFTENNTGKADSRPICSHTEFGQVVDGGPLVCSQCKMPPYPGQPYYHEQASAAKYRFGGHCKYHEANCKYGFCPMCGW